MSGGAARTKERILDAAESLFGERGFAGTSLRALTDAAGVNVASVNYHFGSKEGLLRAVVQRAMASVNADRERMLDQLEAGGDEPTVEELVRAFVTTGASLVARHGERERQVARFIGRVMCEPEPEVRRLFAAEVGPVEGRYAQVLAKALPHLTAEEVAFRYQAMVGLIALHQSGTLADLHPSFQGGPAARASSDATEQLVVMLTGLFQAPSMTDPAAAGGSAAR
ncbi:TetR/AcrR family transcriptional regulator [Actinomadura sp. SCN-SB]|uniref:TetR/AcrR family transcriptional regulator n=1 Tax=Actinomadura sp. SCN-SB TaxID=3373092 RepID=UPI003750242D